MLGAIRFILAVFVLISHLPSNQLKLNIGVTAVICFYFISGYLMTKSYTRFMALSSQPLLAFYKDRIFKLFPQYLLVVLITFASTNILGSSTTVPLLNQEAGTLRVLGNILLLPVNYVFPPFELDFLLPHPIIPPAWSLSTEFHFYLLLPFILTLHKRHFFILMLIALSTQLCSFFFADGIFNANNFGYRFIFGVLTIFLYGMAFARYDDQFYKNIAVTIWGIFTLFLIIIIPTFNLWPNPWVQEISLGAILALPLGIFFTQTTIESQTLHSISKFLGNLAYPIFISHFLSFYLAEKLFSLTSNMTAFYPISIGICGIIAIFLSYLQTHVDKYRIRSRSFSSLQSPETAHSNPSTRAFKVKN